MAVTNWTTETSVDGATGQPIVTITVVDGSGVKYQQDWVSAAPAPTAVVAAKTSSPGTQISNLIAGAEAAVAGPALAARVVARTATPGKVRITNPRG